jgi:hypothetical protein
MILSQSGSLTSEPRTRRSFLVRTGALATAAVMSSIQARSLHAAPTVSVRDLGAKGDGVADDTRAIIDALHDNSSATVVVPAGTYLLKNPVVIRDFSGRLQCEAGSRFVYLDSSQPGWKFLGGNGALITGFRAGWQNRGNTRLGSSAGLLIEGAASKGTQRRNREVEASEANRAGDRGSFRGEKPRHCGDVAQRELPASAQNQRVR